MQSHDDVMDAASQEVQGILEENAAADGDYKAVLDSYNVFRDGLGPWFGLAEKAMLDFLAENRADARGAPPPGGAPAILTGGSLADDHESNDDERGAQNCFKI